MGKDVGTKKWMAFLFVIGGVLGTGAGFALGIFFYPYIFLADVVATEQVSDAETGPVIASGAFIHANPSDPVHYGMGGVTVYEGLVHLGSDFAVGPGPKYKVLLVDKAEIRETADVKASSSIDLGMIKAFKGSQNYPVPADVDPRKFKSVVIWCEAFGVLISPATLNFK